jgi:hypothetical protein
MFESLQTTLFDEHEQMVRHERDLKERTKKETIKIIARWK